MTENERKEEVYTDIYDVIKVGLGIHAEQGVMKHASMDFNLARRTEKEDRFIRRHIQILHQANKIFNPDNVLKVYKQEKEDGKVIGGVREEFRPSKTEIERMKKQMEFIRNQTMEMMRSDINWTNVFARNRDGEMFDVVKNAISEGSKKEVDVSALEKLPLLGGLFKRDEEKK